MSEAIKWVDGGYYTSGDCYCDAKFTRVETTLGRDWSAVEASDDPVKQALAKVKPECLSAVLKNVEEDLRVWVSQANPTNDEQVHMKRAALIDRWARTVTEVVADVDAQRAKLVSQAPKV